MPPRESSGEQKRCKHPLYPGDEYHIFLPDGTGDLVSSPSRDDRDVPSPGRIRGPVSDKAGAHSTLRQKSVPMRITKRVPLAPQQNTNETAPTRLSGNSPITFLRYFMFTTMMALLFFWVIQYFTELFRPRAATNLLLFSTRELALPVMEAADAFFDDHVAPQHSSVTFIRAADRCLRHLKPTFHGDLAIRDRLDTRSTKLLRDVKVSLLQTNATNFELTLASWLNEVWAYRLRHGSKTWNATQECQEHFLHADKEVSATLKRNVDEQQRERRLLRSFWRVPSPSTEIVQTRTRDTAEIDAERRIYTQTAAWLKDAEVHMAAYHRLIENWLTDEQTAIDTVQALAKQCHFLSVITLEEMHGFEAELKQALALLAGRSLDDVPSFEEVWLQLL